MHDYSKHIELLIKSGCKIIQVVSYEWQRVHGFVNQVADRLNMEWYCWSCIKGLQKWDSEQCRFNEVENELTDALDILTYFDEHDDDYILILEDYHPYCREQNEQIIRYLRELSRSSSRKTLVLSQPIKRIPEELSKEIALVEVGLPGTETLKIVAEEVVDINSITNFDITDRLLESALGLTVMEAKLAFTKAAMQKQRLTEAEITLIITEKENIIKKSGLLEYYHPKEDMSSIGGLENLKDWIEKRGHAFDQSAKEYGLNIPKGVLLLGVPGCGKSLTAKAIAKSWNFPLLRFDLGKVFGGIVGESERNIRHALDVAKAISPCVLWIDEIEKGFSGIQGSGSSDGGTTSRVFGTFLTWMQEKDEPVFVIATANDISLLPPELLRKGRFDEIFFVDLPSITERKNIFSIHLNRKNRNIENFEIETLAEKTVGFAGAEIEELINEALFHAFNNGREITTEDIISCADQICPLSKTMSETINGLRKWASMRARKASSQEPEILKQEKEEIPRLKQEVRNPFINKN